MYGFYGFSLKIVERLEGLKPSKRCCRCFNYLMERKIRKNQVKIREIRTSITLINKQ
jgi:hypothetical protein